MQVTHPSALAVLLDGQVQHHSLLSVIDARDACCIALPVIGLYLVDHVGRQVLQGCLHVLPEELLSIHQYLRDGPAVQGIFPVLIYLHSGQLLHQFLHHRTFLHLEGIGVIHQSVITHRHLCHLPLHHRFTHQCGIFTQEHVAQQQAVGLARDAYAHVFIKESHAGEAHDEPAHRHVGEHILPVVACLCELYGLAVIADEMHMHAR